MERDPTAGEPSNPDPAAISAESWQRAEQAAQAVIHCIQPTLESERTRGAVIEYVAKLIKQDLGTEVLPLGSVPLKTYIPEGDIDLTVLATPNSVDTIAGQVRLILESQKNKKHAEFQVEDVQYIRAEVKVVKCLIQNIAVDITFRQIGGIRKLCFLETVDRMIGKNNLFKQSIILIKAWCYYESHILGGRHGLISTYALEILVLYLFQFFHSSLDGPLSVLYRFLDYYTKFDWTNKCITLCGPISVSSLPGLTAKVSENDGGELLLSEDFMRDFVEIFADPSSSPDDNSNIFPEKQINILDPLKQKNNLGRSISEGNFYRIRTAFKYGARRLGNILLLSPEIIGDEINRFFSMTIRMHGSGERPDVQESLSSCSDSTIVSLNSTDLDLLELYFEKTNEATNNIGELCEEINNISISGLDNMHETRPHSYKYSYSESRLNGCVDRNAVSTDWSPKYHHTQIWNNVSWCNTHTNTCEVFPGQPFSQPLDYSENPTIIHSASSMEDMARSHGTGAFIPKVRAYKKEVWMPKRSNFTKSASKNP